MFKKRCKDSRRVGPGSGIVGLLNLRDHGRGNRGGRPDLNEQRGQDEAGRATQTRLGWDRQDGWIAERRATGTGRHKRVGELACRRVECP